MKAKYLGIENYKHGTSNKLGILVVNLGTPEAPTAEALRSYLGEFLSDPRVIEIPKFIWNFILHGIILRVRPAKSAKAYAKVWQEGGSPLMVSSRKLTELIADKLKQEYQSDMDVRVAMRYGQPAISKELKSMQENGVQRLIVLPIYPQYSGATIGSVADAVFQEISSWRWIPELRMMGAYHDNPEYIQAIANSVRKSWEQTGQTDKLLISFHGMPKRTLTLGDPYFCHCHKTARLIAEELALAENQWEMMFQSRFGKAEWLQPYAQQRFEELPKEGSKRVSIICPGFAVDCLETLEEIRLEGAKSFKECGGEEFHYIDCLNTSDEHVELLVNQIADHAGSWLNKKSTAEELVMSKGFAEKAGAKS